MILVDNTEEYVLLRNVHTDNILAVSAAGWKDYKTALPDCRQFEVITRGERGDITLLERLAQPNQFEDLERGVQ